MARRKPQALCPVIKVDRFLGLNNKQDPRRLGWSWQEQLDNYELDDLQRLIVRDGQTTIAAPLIADLYATRDERALYLVTAAGELGWFDDADQVQIISGLQMGPGYTVPGRAPGSHYVWAEAAEASGNVVFVFAPGGAIAIYPDRIVSLGLDAPPAPTVSVISDTQGNIPPGRYVVGLTYYRWDNFESGASVLAVVEVSEQSRLYLSNLAPRADSEIRVYLSRHVEIEQGALELYLAGIAPREATEYGIEADPHTIVTPLDDRFASPPPAAQMAGYPAAVFDGALWCGVPDENHQITRLFASNLLSYGHFVFDEPANYVDVEGELTLLADHPAGLLIGTTTRIALLTRERRLQTLAYYGATRGTADYDDQGRIVFWSERGAARYPGEGGALALLTDDRLSVARGAYGTGMVRVDQGFHRYTVSLARAGTPDHPYTRES